MKKKLMIFSWIIFLNFILINSISLAQSSWGFEEKRNPISGFILYLFIIILTISILYYFISKSRKSKSNISNKGEIMNDNQPYLFGNFYFFFTNLFKPSINKLIEQGNIKELIRIALFPPNMKEYNKIIKFLVKTDITQSVECLLIVFTELEKQFQTSNEDIIQKGRAYSVSIHNIKAVINSLEKPAIGELIKYLDDKKLKIPEFIIDTIVSNGTNDINVVTQISNLIKDGVNASKKNKIKVLKGINKKTKNNEIKDRINILLSNV